MNSNQPNGANMASSRGRTRAAPNDFADDRADKRRRPSVPEPSAQNVVVSGAAELGVLQQQFYPQQQPRLQQQTHHQEVASAPNNPMSYQAAVSALQQSGVASPAQATQLVHVSCLLEKEIQKLRTSANKKTQRAQELEQMQAQIRNQPINLANTQSYRANFQQSHPATINHDAQQHTTAQILPHQVVQQQQQQQQQQHPQLYMQHGHPTSSRRLIQLPHTPSAQQSPTQTAAPQWPQPIQLQQPMLINNIPQAQSAMPITPSPITPAARNLGMAQCNFFQNVTMSGWFCGLDPQYNEVMQQNNSRLESIKIELADPSTFCTTVKELTDWLGEYKAYEPPLLNNITDCVEVAAQHAMSFNSAKDVGRLFETVGRFFTKFSDEHKSRILASYQQYLSETGQRVPAQNAFPLQQVAPQVQQQSNPVHQQIFIQPAHNAGQPALHTSRRRHLVRKQSAHLQPLPQGVLQGAPQSLAFSPIAIPPHMSPPGVNSSVPQSRVQRQHSANVNPNDPKAPIYCRVIKEAIPPLLLEHNMPKREVYFPVEPVQFQRLFVPKLGKNICVEPEISELHLPLTYQLTACKITNSSNLSYNDRCEWPEGLLVRLNGQEVRLEKKMKTPVPGRPGSFTYSGRDRPIDISVYLKEGTNTLMLEQKQCCCVSSKCQDVLYAVFVFIMLRETRDLIVERVMSHITDVVTGIKFLNKLLSGSMEDDDDDDVVVIQECIIVKMTCPISLCRIQHPVKGAECQHVQCFDLYSYLDVNQTNPTWRCPHCHKKLPSNELIVDGFFKQLLQQVPSSIDDVKLEQGGHWTAVVEKATDADPEDSPQPIETVADPPKTSDVIIIDSSSDDETPMKLQPTSSRMSAPAIPGMHSSPSIPVSPCDPVRIQPMNSPSIQLPVTSQIVQPLPAGQKLHTNTQIVQPSFPSSQLQATSQITQSSFVQQPRIKSPIVPAHQFILPSPCQTIAINPGQKQIDQIFGEPNVAHSKHVCLAGPQLRQLSGDSIQKQTVAAHKFYCQSPSIVETNADDSSTEEIEEEIMMDSAWLAKNVA